MTRDRKGHLVSLYNLDSLQFTKYSEKITYFGKGNLLVSSSADFDAELDGQIRRTVDW